MSATQDKIQIDNPIAIFGEGNGLIGAVMYMGDLHGAQPVEAHVDMGNKKLTMIFNTGKAQVEKEIAPLSQDNVSVIKALSAFNKNSTPEKIGFYQVNAEGALKADALFNVPVLIMK